MTEKKIGNYLVKFNFDRVEIDFTYTKRIVFEIVFYGIAGILILLSPLLAQNSFVVYYQLGSIILVIGGISVLSIAAKRLFTPRQEIIVIDKNAQTLTFKKNNLKKVTIPFNQISSIKLQNNYTKEESNSDSLTIFKTFHSDLIISTKKDADIRVVTFETKKIIETEIDKQEKLDTIATSSEIGTIVSDACGLQLEKIQLKRVNKN